MFLKWNRRLQLKNSFVFVSALGIGLPSPPSRKAACCHCKDGLGDDFKFFKLDSFTFPNGQLKWAMIEPWSSCMMVLSAWPILKWNRFSASTCYVSGYVACYVACKHSPRSKAKEACACSLSCPRTESSPFCSEDDFSNSTPSNFLSACKSGSAESLLWAQGTAREIAGHRGFSWRALATLGALSPQSAPSLQLRFSEHLEFNVLHFQIVGLDKQTGDEGANVFAVLTGGIRACAREAAKNVFYSLWLYHPHPIVYFAVTIEILLLHYISKWMFAYWRRFDLLLQSFHGCSTFLFDSAFSSFDLWASAALHFITSLNAVLN